MQDAQRSGGAFTPARVPTPAEIAERAAAIRATWSRAELRRREAYPPEPFAVPVVQVDDMDSP